MSDPIIGFGQDENFPQVAAGEPVRMSDLTYKAQAYKRGEDAAIAAASWVIDGNTSQDHIRRMVKWFDDGDPMNDHFLPARPNLSGEWGDEYTPHSLVNDVCGLTNCTSEMRDEICEAFDEGVADHFEPECERILRAAITED